LAGFATAQAAQFALSACRQYSAEAHTEAEAEAAGAGAEGEADDSETTTAAYWQQRGFGGLFISDESPPAQPSAGADSLHPGSGVFASVTFAQPDSLGRVVDRLCGKSDESAVAGESNSRQEWDAIFAAHPHLAGRACTAPQPVSFLSFAAYVFDSASGLFWDGVRGVWYDPRSQTYMVPSESNTVYLRIDPVSGLFVRLVSAAPAAADPAEKASAAAVVAAAADGLDPNALDMHALPGVPKRRSEDGDEDDAMTPTEESRAAATVQSVAFRPMKAIALPAPPRSSLVTPVQQGPTVPTAAAPPSDAPDTAIAGDGSAAMDAEDASLSAANPAAMAAIPRSAVLSRILDAFDAAASGKTVPEISEPPVTAAAIVSASAAPAAAPAAAEATVIQDPVGATDPNIEPGTVPIPTVPATADPVAEVAPGDRRIGIVGVCLLCRRAFSQRQRLEDHVSQSSLHAMHVSAASLQRNAVRGLAPKVGEAAEGDTSELAAWLMRQMKWFDSPVLAVLPAPSAADLALEDDEAAAGVAMAGEAEGSGVRDRAAERRGRHGIVPYSRASQRGRGGSAGGLGRNGLFSSRSQQTAAAQEHAAELESSSKLLQGWGAAMLARMGWRQGEGLGKSRQGIVMPLAAKRDLGGVHAGTKTGLGGSARAARTAPGK
jgi:hypothetical protein